MPRIVSVFLPRWPILRFLAAQARHPNDAPVDPARPFVLSVDTSNTPCIAALNEAAQKEGLAAGDRLADARARTDFLQVRPAEPAADDAALRKLALWATRYTPAVACFDAQSGADGFFLDVTGAAHLFGGEEMLLADLSRRFEDFGLPARLAIADTAGAAWALSRYSPSPSILLSGQEAKALSDLPIEALRLSSDTRTTLQRLGFKHIGALIGTPRAPFAARFEQELLRRLDQALGLAPEPLHAVIAPPVYHSARYLLEPVSTIQAVLALAARLMRDLMHALVRDGAGARALRLSLYRVDGDVAALDVGLAMPTRDIGHVVRLIELKLDYLDSDIDAGFGFETVDLAVTAAEPLSPRQGELMAALQDVPEQSAALVDRLKQRLGERSVRRLTPLQSHQPERAETRSVADGETPVWPSPGETQPRPLVLLPKAEKLEAVTALVPDGPPRHFRWRGAIHEVARAQGPERIADEWWRNLTGQPTRDYYLVEDEEGRRFWLYREGLFERETTAPGWFMHGLFA
jgi:protein ImuB